MANNYTKFDLESVADEKKEELVKWIIDHSIEHWWSGVDTLFVADDSEALMIRLTFGL